VNFLGGARSAASTRATRRSTRGIRLDFNQPYHVFSPHFSAASRARTGCTFTLPGGTNSTDAWARKAFARPTFDRPEDVMGTVSFRVRRRAAARISD
jgi:hypothetical protein